MDIEFDQIITDKELTIEHLVISSGKITGAYHGDDLIQLLYYPKKISQGTIKIANQTYKKYNPKTIAIIDKNIPFYTVNVEEEIMFQAKIRNYKTHSMKDEILVLLKELELDPSILSRICHSLSESEKYLIKLISNLIYQPDIIVFRDVMKEMDYHNKKNIKKLIENLKVQNKIIILTSKDSNILYELTDQVILFNEQKMVRNDDTMTIYTDVPFLIDHHIDVPFFSLLTYKANQEKNAHLFYRKDVRDVIKDVYKSVS